MNIQSKKTHLASYVKNNANFTRSQVVKLLQEKRILVNGKLMPLSYVVTSSDVVTIDGEKIQTIPKVCYIYNKPKGLICTNNDIEESIINHINIEHKVFCVGRLDKESRGLVILTNDGDFSNSITNPISKVEKEYIVTVKEAITEEFLKKMQESIIIKGRKTYPAKIYVIDDYRFGIILKDGKYHQIRRLVVNAKNVVTDLIRIRVGNFILDDLEESRIKKITDYRNL